MADLKVFSQPANLPKLVGVQPLPSQPNLKVLPLAKPLPLKVQPLQQTQPSIQVSSSQNQPNLVSPQAPSPKPLSGSIKGTVIELGQKFKAKYPGAYDDLTDAELGRKAKKTYVGSYDDFVDVPDNFQAQEPPQDAGLFHDINAPAYDLTNQPLNGTGIAKSGANILKSLVRFGKDVVTSPYTTAKQIVSDIPNAISGYSQELKDLTQSEQAAQELEARAGRTNPAPVDIKSLVPNLRKATVEAITPTAFKQGSFRGGLQSIAEDPYQLTPAFLALQGALKTSLGDTTLGKVTDNAISNTSKVVTTPVDYVANKFKNVTNTLARFGISQITGLAPETINTFINSADIPKEVLRSFTREGVGQELAQGINTRLSELSTTGKGYEAIRNSDGLVKIPPGALTEFLSKYKIGLDENGKIITDAESIPMSATDKAGLQDFISTFGKAKTLTNNALLNARTALSNLSKYDATKTNASTILARDLRSFYDGLAKDQVKGLAQLDAQYAPEVELLNKIKREYLNPDGSLKDGAFNKIANLGNRGKELTLARAEKIVPDLGKKIAIMRALEDMQNATGNKVGTYTRGIVGGGLLVSGNVPALIISAILTNPSSAFAILRAYGKLLGLKGTQLNSYVNDAIKNLSKAGVIVGAQNSSNKTNEQ